MPLSLDQQYAVLQDVLASRSVECWRDDPRAGMIAAAEALNARIGDEKDKLGGAHDASRELATAAQIFLNDPDDGADSRERLERGWPARLGGLHTAFVDVIANTLIQCAVRVALTSRDSFSVGETGVHPSVLVAMKQGKEIAKQILTRDSSRRRGIEILNPTRGKETTRALVTAKRAALTAEGPMFFMPQAAFTGPTSDIHRITDHVATLRSCRDPNAPNPAREDFSSYPFPTMRDMTVNPYLAVALFKDAHAFLACAFRWLRLHRFVMTSLVRHPVAEDDSFDTGKFWAPFKKIAFGQYGAFDAFVRDAHTSVTSLALVRVFVDLTKVGYGCLDEEAGESASDDAARVDGLLAMDVVFRLYQKSAFHDTMDRLEASAERSLRTGDRALLWPAPDLLSPQYSAALLAVSSTMNICAMQVARVATPEEKKQFKFKSIITAAAFRFAEAHIEALANSIRPMPRREDEEQFNDLSRFSSLGLSGQKQRG